MKIEYFNEAGENVTSTATAQEKLTLLGVDYIARGVGPDDVLAELEAVVEGFHEGRKFTSRFMMFAAAAFAILAMIAVIIG